MPSRLALLIGAYGGEHIGDMGILGGVLLRLADREKITHAVVASFRPERTRRLVSLINPAVPLEVAPYDLAAMRRSVRDADVLVWAGGPLGDWPRVLTRNLTTAVAARALGMPFVVEGIGIRRLKRWPSRRMGIALLRLATSITVRSKGAASEVVRLAGRPAAVSRDPAFDYIANRSVSDLMTPQEEARIQELASRPASTRLICVNVRPAARRAAQPMVSAALKRLATAMTAFARIHPARYVFFPLETETDTGSDFDTADELAGYVAPEVDLRICRELPTLDGTLCLLRHADAAVTMRFHGAVFALSQSVPTVGIDYSHSGSGKIGDLFNERGEGDRVLDFMDVNPEKIVRLLIESTR